MIASWIWILESNSLSCVKTPEDKPYILPEKNTTIQSSVSPSVDLSETPTHPITSRGQSQRKTDLDSSLSEWDQSLMSTIRTRYASGDYYSALTLALETKAALTVSPDLLAWIDDNLGLLLISVAFLEVHKGQCELAIPRFNQVLNHDPNNLAALKGLGYCHFRYREWSQAQATFEKYLSLNPTDDKARLLQAQVFEAMLRFDEALTRLQTLKGAVAVSERARIDKKILSIQKKLDQHQRMELKLSEHFSVYLPGNALGLGHWALDTLEAAFDEFVSVFGVHPDGAVFRVIFSSHQAFEVSLPQVPHWASAAFDGQIRIPLPSNDLEMPEFQERLEQALRHELVHAIVSQLKGRSIVPQWFEEGLAQFFTCYQRGCDPVEFNHFRGDFLHVGDFLSSFSHFNAYKARRAYQQSLFLVRLLNRFDPGWLPFVCRSISSLGSESFDVLLPGGLKFNEWVDLATRMWSDGLPLKRHEIEKGLDITP